ncbi:MAG: sulfite reductase subunit A [Chloroflexi bacterium RBG_16_57_9]|nr:MAG: sulfite reductase subunit A [Chloroflexi bacterium RBG_16_57_9]
MRNSLSQIGAQLVLAKTDLQSVFDALRADGYEIVGPTVRDGAIVYDALTHMGELPIGWTEVQSPGSYRLERRTDDAFFGFVVGPHAWKRYLQPPVLKLFSVEKRNGGLEIRPETEPVPRYAFVGVRPCDLQAIDIQDRVFLGGPYQDPGYKARRTRAFVLAVNCTEPGGTCFCVSMHTGPQARTGFDLALTELDEVFLFEVGSGLGAEIVAALDARPASAFELHAADERLAAAAQRMGRQLDTSDLPGLLYDNLEHPHWDDVARRCLSCANCTQVCPTCFCSDIQDVTDISFRSGQALLGQVASRVRVWDSCFTLDFSHIHGGNLRPMVRSRYRQWLTHKLAAWIDQFGVLGCVGCGRCITWCPVGIDITEELKAIRKEAV